MTSVVESVPANTLQIVLTMIVILISAGVYASRRSRKTQQDHREEDARRFADEWMERVREADQNEGTPTASTANGDAEGDPWQLVSGDEDDPNEYADSDADAQMRRPVAESRQERNIAGGTETPQKENACSKHRRAGAVLVGCPHGVRRSPTTWAGRTSS